MYISHAAKPPAITRMTRMASQRGAGWLTSATAISLLVADVYSLSSSHNAPGKSRRAPAGRVPSHVEKRNNQAPGGAGVGGHVYVAVGRGRGQKHAAARRLHRVQRGQLALGAARHPLGRAAAVLAEPDARVGGDVHPPGRHG